MKTIIKTKTIWVLAFILAHAYFSTIQASAYGEEPEFFVPDPDAFRHESPAEQTQAGIFRLPSEATLEEAPYGSLLTMATDDGWLDLPGEYGGEGNALKMPVGEGWGILSLVLSFYMLFFVYRRKKSEL